MSQDPATGFVYLDIQGRISTSDVMENFAKLKTKYGSDGALYVLADYQHGGFVEEPELYHVNMTDIKESFHKYFKSLGQIFAVYVVPRGDETTRVLIQQFIKMVSGVDSFKAAIVETRAEAENWLKSNA